MTRDSGTAVVGVDEYVDALTNLCLRGHPQFARAHAEATAALDPLMGQLGRAAVAASTSDVKTLRESVEAAAALAPAHPGVAQARAVMHALAGEPVAAVQAARRAVELEPSLRARNGLARLLLATGQVQEGVSILQALVADHGDVDAHIQLAATVTDDNESLHHLVEAFLASPADERAMQSLMQLMRTTSWPLGVMVVTRHLRTQEVGPGFRYVCDLLGLAALELLRESPWASLVQTSDSVFSNAVAAAREVPVLARTVVAGFLIDHGRLAEARALLASIGTAATTAAERSRQRFFEGRLAAAEGSDERAAEHYRAALASDPLNVDAASDLIDILLGTRRREAYAEIAGILNGVPEVTRRLDVGLTFNEALWYEALGEKEKALYLAQFLLEGDVGKFRSAIAAMQVRLAGFTN